ncbi:hypothetical protein CaCOL14_010985 [Colletotrichum acutatum]
MITAVLLTPVESNVRSRTRKFNLPHQRRSHDPESTRTRWQNGGCGILQRNERQHRQDCHRLWICGLL